MLTLVGGDYYDEGGGEINWCIKRLKQSYIIKYGHQILLLKLEVGKMFLMWGGLDGLPENWEWPDVYPVISRLWGMGRITVDRKDFLNTTCFPIVLGFS